MMMRMWKWSDQTWTCDDLALRSGPTVSTYVCSFRHRRSIGQQKGFTIQNLFVPPREYSISVAIFV